MSDFFLVTSSFIVLLVASSGFAYLAKLWKIPATVALVTLGMILAFLAKIQVFSFLDDFQMSSDILFYVFLPILLFESAYEIRYKELLRNIRSISALAVVSLIISAFFIAVVIHAIFGWIGLEMPFIVALLFGSLISSTDTAAALTIFKDLGVPRRLSLIFEGESLFNDGTAVALFLVVLGTMESQATNSVTVTHHNLYAELISPLETSSGLFFPFLNGIFSLVSMTVFGVIIGAMIGILFSKVIQKIRNEKYLEIALSLALAHTAFLLAELANHYLIPVSGIIATVAAAMVLGNYGRYKISPKVEEVMARYWGFFAFVANSLVFVLVGMMLINLNVNWKVVFPMMLITVPVVIIARAISVYSVFSFLNHIKKEERVPRSWQHVLSWGALRGGLAVIMVLLIPSDIVIPGWSDSHLSIRDLLLSMTLGVVLFSIFVKTLTIAPLIRHFGINKLHAIEEFRYITSRILLATESLAKIEKIRLGGYINLEEISLLKKRYEKQLLVAKNDAQIFQESQGENFPSLTRRVLALYALGIEKYWLRQLYKNNEIPEVVFKRIMNRLIAQIRRLERGEMQIEIAKNTQAKTDIFERITEYVIDRLEPKIDPVKEQYIEIRTIHVIIEKALEALFEIGKIEFIFEQKEYMEIIQQYEGFRENAEQERRALFREHRDFLKKLSASMTEKSLIAANESIVEDLAEKEAISPKLARYLDKILFLRD